MSEIKKSQPIIKTELIPSRALEVYKSWGFFDHKKNRAMTLFQNMKEQTQMNKEIKEALFNSHDENESNNN